MSENLDDEANATSSLIFKSVIFSPAVRSQEGKSNAPVLGTHPLRGNDEKYSAAHRPANYGGLKRAAKSSRSRRRAEGAMMLRESMMASNNRGTKAVGRHREGDDVDSDSRYSSSGSNSVEQSQSQWNRSLLVAQLGQGYKTRSGSDQDDESKESGIEKGQKFVRIKTGNSMEERDSKTADEKTGDPAASRSKLRQSLQARFRATVEKTTISQHGEDDEWKGDQQ